MTLVLQPVSFSSASEEIRESNGSSISDDITADDISPLNHHEHKLLRPNISSDMLPEKRKFSTESESTAVMALQKAVQLKRLKKFEKAEKLFQHSLFQCPSHPDSLTHYGEFLEEVKKNIIKADHFYLKALTICPQHATAVENSKRTRPLVDNMDEEQLLRISFKKVQFNSAPPSELLKRIQRDDYFEHIYNTLAIEGNTMSLDETRTFIETGVPIPNKSSFEHNEILGMVDALKFINDWSLQNVMSVTVSDILNIHNKIMNYVHPSHAGKLRDIQVFVGNHTPPAASKVHNLMEMFCKWLNLNLEEIHPVKLAALAHQKLAFIHPFVDGNGRTARLIMNFILIRAGYPSIIVRKKDIDIYFDNLQIADEYDVRPFLRFIAQIAEETLDIYCQASLCQESEVSNDLKF